MNMPRIDVGSIFGSSNMMTIKERLLILPFNEKKYADHRRKVQPEIIINPSCKFPVKAQIRIYNKAVNEH